MNKHPITLINNLLPWLVLFFLSFPSWQALLHPGFFTMHDFQQVARLYEMDKSLLSGQFPVRWVADLGFGYGYALFNFYPPLTYYLGEIFHLVLRTSFIDSVKIVWFLALLGSAVTMYLLVKEMFGKVSGIVSAAFYLYAPYHAVDAYVRGALAELFSFAWLPLILLFTYKSYTSNETFYSILTGIFLALLMITHNLTFLPFFAFWALWYWGLWVIMKRKNILVSLEQFCLSTLTAFLLSAFFWLPSLVEKKYTLVDQFLTQNLASYQIHFVCPIQLWSSPWGFGGSVAGCTDGLSFMVGKLHLILSALALAAGVYFYKSGKNKPALLILVAFLLLVFSLFMTTNSSRLVWDNISPLWYLQFPWRFLEFAALFSAILAGAILQPFKSIVVQILLGAGLILSVLFVEARYFRPQVYLPAANDNILLSDQEIKWKVSATSFEYMPSGIAYHPTASGGYLPDIDQNGVGLPRYTLLRGNLKITNFSFHPNSVSMAGLSNQGALVQLPITNFPGWQTKIDNQPVVITDNNKLKLITVSFPPGEHELKVNFADTPVRKVGNTVSLISLVILFISFIYGTRAGTRRS